MPIPQLLTPFGYREKSPQQHYYCGRVGIHLTRLILPEFYSSELMRFKRVDSKKIQNTFCRDFGVSYIRYSNSIESEQNRIEGYKIQKRIGSEGEGVFTFWTIVPYVFADLRQRGNDEFQAMEKIFRWIFESRGEGPSFEPRFAPFGEHFDFWRFPEPLGFDERMPTHLRARLLSKETAQGIQKYLN